MFVSGILKAPDGALWARLVERRVLSNQALAEACLQPNLHTHGKSVYICTSSKALEGRRRSREIWRVRAGTPANLSIHLT